MAEKIGFFDKVRIFFGEVRTEMGKVVWPTQEQVKTYTIIVLVAAAILSTVIGIWDIGVTRVVSYLLSFGT